MLSALTYICYQPILKLYIINLDLNMKLKNYISNISCKNWRTTYNKINMM